MSRKLLLLAALAALTPALARAAEPAPRFFAYPVGKAQVLAVQDTEMEMGTALFRNADPAVLARAMPAGKVTASVTSFVVRTGGKTILVDTGHGATGAGGHLLASLAAAGVDPAAVDLVVLTHAHSDHTGGLLDKAGAPAFPRATIAFSRAEAATVDDAGIARLPEEYRPYYLPAHAALAAYGERVQLLTPGEAVADGVTVVDLAGHTPGQIGLLVTSGKARLLIAGDALHVGAVQFAHPEYCLVYDGDVEAAAKTRRALFTRLSKERLPMAATHLPFPGIGTVAREGKAFRFTPVKAGG